MLDARKTMLDKNNDKQLTISFVIVKIVKGVWIKLFWWLKLEIEFCETLPFLKPSNKLKINENACIYVIKLCHVNNFAYGSVYGLMKKINLAFLDTSKYAKQIK